MRTHSLSFILRSTKNTYRLIDHWAIGRRRFITAHNSWTFTGILDLNSRLPTNNLRGPVAQDVDYSIWTKVAQRTSWSEEPEMAMRIGTGWDSHSHSHYSREYWEREWKFPRRQYSQHSRGYWEWEWKISPRLYSHYSREFREWGWLSVGIPNSQQIPKYCLFQQYVISIEKTE